MSFADQFEGIEQGGGADDGRAVLVVVHDGDVQFFFQPLLDFKTFRRGNIFQVDTAKSGLENFDRAHEFVHVFGVEFQVETVNIGVNLEQEAFPLHHRFAGFGADVAQAQHGRAVGDDGHEVALGGVFIHVFGIFGNRQAGFGHARGVGQGQVALGGGFFGGNDLDFTRAAFGVVMQRQASFLRAFFSASWCRAQKMRTKYSRPDIRGLDDAFEDQNPGN